MVVAFRRPTSGAACAAVWLPHLVLGLRGDDAEAGDDGRFNGDDGVSVVDPRIKQLLVARDFAGIGDGVCVPSDDDAPARPSLGVDAIGFVGDDYAVSGSHGRGDRCCQAGANDYPAFVHQMIDRADRRKRVESEDDASIADAGQQSYCLRIA